MSILDNARDTVIQGGALIAISLNFNFNNHNDVAPLLLTHGERSFLLDDVQPTESLECDEAILSQMKAFVDAGAFDSPPAIYCLYGPPGVARSALAKSLVLSLRRVGSHAASLFFSQLPPGENGVDQLIATLAYQLVVNIPGLGPFVSAAIQQNPSVFRSSPNEQLRILVVHPINLWRFYYDSSIQQAIDRDPNANIFPRRLILIDSMDERVSPEIQRGFTLCIGHAIRNLSLPFRFVFIGRPEPHVISTFELDPVFHELPNTPIIARHFEEINVVMESADYEDAPTNSTFDCPISPSSDASSLTLYYTPRGDILELSDDLPDDADLSYSARGPRSRSSFSSGSGSEESDTYHTPLQMNLPIVQGSSSNYHHRRASRSYGLHYYGHQDGLSAFHWSNNVPADRWYRHVLKCILHARFHPAHSIQGFSSVWHHTQAGPGLSASMDEPTQAKSMVRHTSPSPVVSLGVLVNATRNSVDNVLKVQYPLGNRKALPDMIWRAINAHTDSREAISLLSKAYYGRQQNPRFAVLGDSETLESVRKIGASLSGRARFSADDAMTALHIVSLYLFDGGRGKWNQFLSFAAHYVRDVLEAPQYHGQYAQALEYANPKDQFVVKTTIWFDVLASITTQEPPKLMEYIRGLFKPGLSWVGRPYTYSMLDPMGCENEVVWALAETACLSLWKRRHEYRGDLSIRELILKAAEIDQHLAPGPRPFPPQPDEDSWRRFLASEIFRTSARLFLKSVECGDHPHVREVRACVDECYDAIMRYPRAEGPNTRSTIVRSAVFGVFICGALTDDPLKQNVLRTHLMQNAGSEGVGNVNVVLEIVENIWQRNGQQGRNVAVQWRHYLKHYEVLLV